MTGESSRPHKKALVVKFESISDRDVAEGLRGLDLVIPESELPPPPPGSHYQFQLVGLTVVTTSGDLLGKVSRILETGANDVYLVLGEDGGETLIPAIKDVVVEIDLEGGRMVVDPLPEL